MLGPLHEQPERKFAAIEPMDSRDVGTEMTADEHNAPAFRESMIEVILTERGEASQRSFDFAVGIIEGIVARQVAWDVGDER